MYYFVRVYFLCIVVQECRQSGVTRGGILVLYLHCWWFMNCPVILFLTNKIY